LHAYAAADDAVVVAGKDRALIAALGDALAPTRVIAVDDEAPTAIGGLAAASRQIVEREHTRSAVWLISDGTSTTLVAYDREVDRVLIRPLPYPVPLSEENAAVTARSARTMLRALAETPSPAVTAPAAVAIAPPPPVIVSQQLLATHAGFAVRVGAPGSTATAELALGAIWRPRSFGIAVTATLAPASALRGQMFDGDIGDRSIALAARFPLAVSPRIAIAGLAGGSLHAIRFAGMGPTRPIRDWRFDPALYVRVEGAYALTKALDVGVAVAMDNLLRRQRYEVEGEEIVVMKRLQVAGGVFLSLRVL
jgi:hypothetical protein